MKLVIRTTTPFKWFVFNFLTQWYSLSSIYNRLSRDGWMFLEEENIDRNTVELYRVTGTYLFKATYRTVEEPAVTKEIDHNGDKPTLREGISILRQMFRSTDFYKTCSHGKTYLLNYFIMRRIRKAAATMLRRIEKEVYVTQDDGSVLPRWEIEVSEDSKSDPNYKRRVVTAANQYGNYVTLGVRHYCKHMAAEIDLVGGTKVLRAYAWFHNGRKGPTEVQGFICNYGIFLNRQEAMILARERDQFFGYYKEPHALAGDTLYSEIIH